MELCGSLEGLLLKTFSSFSLLGGGVGLNQRSVSAGRIRVDMY